MLPGSRIFDFSTCSGRRSWPEKWFRNWTICLKVNNYISITLQHTEILRIQFIPKLVKNAFSYDKQLTVNICQLNWHVIFHNQILTLFVRYFQNIFIITASNRNYYFPRSPFFHSIILLVSFLVHFEHLLLL